MPSRIQSDSGSYGRGGQIQFDDDRFGCDVLYSVIEQEFVCIRKRVAKDSDIVRASGELQLVERQQDFVNTHHGKTQSFEESTAQMEQLNFGTDIEHSHGDSILPIVICSWID